MIQVTVTGETAEEVLSAVREFASKTLGIQPTLVIQKEEKPKKEKKAVEQAAPATAAPATAAAAPAAATAAPTTEGATAAPATAAPAADTFMVLADTLSKLVLKRGKPTGIALLTEFGVKRAGELKDAQYGAFLARANGLLDGTQTITLQG